MFIAFKCKLFTLMKCLPSGTSFLLFLTSQNMDPKIMNRAIIMTGIIQFHFLLFALASLLPSDGMSTRSTKYYKHEFMTISPTCQLQFISFIVHKIKKEHKVINIYMV